MSILYDRISQLCDEQGVSISAMCKRAGVSTGNISELKSGRRKSITTETAVKIAKALSVPVGALFGGPKEFETIFIDGAADKEESGSPASGLEAIKNCEEADVSTEDIDTMNAYPTDIEKVNHEDETLTEEDVIELESASLLGGKVRFRNVYRDGNDVTATIEIAENVMSLNELRVVLDTFIYVNSQGIPSESFAKAASELAKIIAQRESQK